MTIFLTIVYQIGPVEIGDRVFNPPDLVQHLKEPLTLPPLKKRSTRSKSSAPWRPTSVTMRAKVRGSGALYYDKGDWDKIPYLLEITGEVQLATPTDLTREELAELQDEAFQAASAGVLRNLQPFKEDLLEKIEFTLFPDLFGHGSTDV